MHARLFLTAPGPPCPKCGRDLAEHPDRWTLDDYVKGMTGAGPRITAAQVGGVKCVPSEQTEPEDPRRSP